MDFGALLHIAKKNSESTKNQGNYYCTKYAPPKKESKDKKLSDNIQKFLQKRDKEERERKHDERQKVASLLAMRDDKAKNKIRKMLKVTKSANKSVLDDAKETGGTTAVEGTASDQLDQDDYGYVSTEANAFYQKYIEKVKDVKDDKGFAPSRPQSLRDLSGTKERVKAAITRERDESKSHTRQRISTVNSTPSSSGVRESNANVARAYATSASSKSLYDPQAEKRDEDRQKREEEQKKAKNRRPPPPPINFQALLKLAEKKQYEPVAVLQPEVKKKTEPERLLSAREKREYEERQRFMEDRARRERERDKPKERKQDVNSSNSNNSSNNNRVESNGRIPKLNQSSKSLTQPKATNPKVCSASSNNKPKPAAAAAASASGTTSSAIASSKQGSSSTNSASVSKAAGRSLGKPTQSSTISKPSKTSTGPSKPASNAAAPSTSALNNQSKNPYGPTKNSTHNGPTREFPPRDLSTIKSRQFPPADVQCTRQFPPADVQRARQFPLSDVRRATKPAAGSRKPPPPIGQKRRIYDDDDDYDSELEDFIDDGDCEEDISSHIRDIFGYDKRKYRDFDEDDDNMESSFAQVQREEFISKKIGLQEDLDDMRQEAIDKKRKIQKKRRLPDDDEDD